MFSVISKPLVGWVLFVCRDTVGVFYSPSRLGNQQRRYLYVTSNKNGFVYFVLFFLETDFVHFSQLNFSKIVGHFVLVFSLTLRLKFIYVFWTIDLVWFIWQSAIGDIHFFFKSLNTTGADSWTSRTSLEIYPFLEQWSAGGQGDRLGDNMIGILQGSLRYIGSSFQINFLS